MLLDELIALVEPDPGAHPGESDVEKFQAESGYQLPIDLASLLAKTGGRTLKRDAIAKWPHEHVQGGTASLYIHRLYGFNLDAYSSVRPLSVHIGQMEACCEGVPDGIFCFGDDGCGNVVTIDLRDGTYGNVGLVDHETVGDRFTDPETYELVAGSFEEFLAMLYPDDEEYE